MSWVFGLVSLSMNVVVVGKVFVFFEGQVARGVVKVVLGRILKTFKQLLDLCCNTSFLDHNILVITHIAVVFILKFLKSLEALEVHGPVRGVKIL